MAMASAAPPRSSASATEGERYFRQAARASESSEKRNAKNATAANEIKTWQVFMPVIPKTRLDPFLVPVQRRNS